MNFYIVYYFVQSCLKYLTITTLKIECVEVILLTHSKPETKEENIFLFIFIDIRRRTQLR